MANFVCQVLLTEKPLLPLANITVDETGAVVDFWGVVRETEAGTKIRGIDYEAHRAMAEHQLQMVAQRAGEVGQLTQITIQHRIGFVPVGAASLLVRVASKHRAEAFRASAAIVDELKKCAPIWKHPVLADGSSSSTNGVLGPGKMGEVSCPA